MRQLDFITKIASFVASDELVSFVFKLCWAILVVFSLYSTWFIIRETYFYKIKPLIKRHRASL